MGRIRGGTVRFTEAVRLAMELQASSTSRRGSHDR